MKPITEVAQQLHIDAAELELYGKYKAKLSNDIWERVKDHPDGKLILVTSINPTPAGEGKTLTTIGLSQAMNQIGRKTIAALREPSLGPTFGVKGGATGSGRAQVLPSEEINLHFTGDMHAITSAHNLLAAMIDNHIYYGNALQIDVNNILWKRVVDMNDRALRNIVIGLGEGNGTTREEGYMITVASEIMAILCLSSDIEDLKRRIGQIIIGYNHTGAPITAKDLNAEGAMTALLKDAIKPNLVQTIEGTPVVIHGGPFANIAHGCSSLIGTRMSLKLADYVVTEAGFGADLGAEKFLDIKCRIGDLHPNAAVIVATVKALKHNAGVKKSELALENLAAVEKGFANLARHIENIQDFGLPLVVAINRFATDTEQELALIQEMCRELGVEVALSEVWERGGAGGIELAEKLVRLLDDEPADFHYLYDTALPIKDKIEKIVTELYRGKKVEYSKAAEKAIRKINELNMEHLPICIAKTQYSFSDDPTLLLAPTDFTFNVREVKLSAGAGFIVVIAGNIMTMPGLPKVPASENIDVDFSGNIVGIS